jgi:ammonium transporter, Amt family
VGLAGVGLEPNQTTALRFRISFFCAFQMMFAIITPALITGAFVERIRFSTFIVFTLLWATLVYDPVAHWVWGVGGFLREMGALDFAGGTVVHVLAGFSALAFALVIGPRKAYSNSSIEPANIPFTILGAGCFGWAGSDSTEEVH